MLRALAAVDRVSRLLAWAAMAMLVVLVADMMYEVAARRAFAAPTLWAYDVAYMLNGLIFIFAAGHTLRTNGHVRIDFLSSRLPLKIQDWINVAVYLLLLFPAMSFLVAGAWQEWREAFVTDELDPASPWRPLLWPLFAGILIGFASLFLQIAAECARHCRGALGLGRSPLRHRGDDASGA